MPNTTEQVSRVHSQQFPSEIQQFYNVRAVLVDRLSQQLLFELVQKLQMQHFFVSFG